MTRDMQDEPQTPSLKWRRHERDDGVVLEFSGRIDLTSSPEFRRQLLKAMDTRQPLRVDLAQVSHIDSSGMASLVQAYAAAKRRSLPFVVSGVRPAMMQMFRLVRLDQVLPLDEGAAVPGTRDS